MSLATVAATAIGFALLAPGFRFTTAITEFLPDGSDRSARVAALLAQSQAARVLIVDVSTPSPQPLHAVATSLLEFLRASPEVASVRSGVGERDATATLEFLRNWPATAFIAATQYSDEALRTRLLELRDQLAGPLSAVVRGTAARDPLGGTWQLLRALAEWQPSSILDDDGILVTPDRRHAFLFVETKASPFDSDAQRRFRAVLGDWISRSAPSQTQWQTAGAAQFAIASEAQIKRDIHRISVISTIGILATFLMLFGSIRLIAIGFVPMLFGSAVAMIACHAWFGQIHGITVAFGTSLLGVGLDYTEHYFAHFVLTPTVPANLTMKQVAPSIALGALTTVIGFVGIAASGVAGLRQMAAFAVIAIAASMAATYWLVPPWMPTQYRPPRALGAVNRSVLAVLQWLTRRGWSRSARALLVMTAGTTILFGIRAVTFSDNVNMLVDESEQHVRDDREVRSRLGPEASVFAVVTAATDDALAIAVQRVTAELAAARAAGGQVSALPLNVLAPSAAEQMARWRAARSNADRIRTAMLELGFVPAQFRAFWDDLAVAAPRLLTLADLRNSPFAPLLAAALPAPANTGPVALIPIVSAVTRDRALASDTLRVLRERVPSASIIEPATAIVEAFRSVRTNTLVASSCGFAAIAMLLFARYRRPRSVAIALCPALFACVATVTTLAAMGIALTILHVMSLLLVVSLGVDFGIFLVDAAATPEESARTMVSIVTASVTTLLSFGLLAASSSPVLAALGMTVTLGVGYSLGFCILMAAALDAQKAVYHGGMAT